MLAIRIHIHMLVTYTHNQVWSSLKHIACADQLQMTAIRRQVCAQIYSTYT